MGEPWFKPRSFGYGATPITWQGWVITIATMAIVVFSSLLIPVLAAGTLWVFSAIVIDVVAVVGLLVVSRGKTEGEWRWRWGNE
jgi:hypothetical protein